MLLGKRPRPPIKRTMSITEFTVDLSNVEAAQMPFDPRTAIRDLQKPVGGGDGGVVNIPDGFDHRLLATISPRNNSRRNSGDFAQPSHFLRACGLCNRRLAPGRDIYMYRGDTAFCSLECRQQQMNQDERKEKDHPSSSSTVGSDQGSSKGGTVAAA